MGKKIFHYEEIDSTNREALDMAKNGAEEGTVVVSECQRQGRGRFQRVWESPRSKGTYFSFILRPCVPMKSVPQLTLLTGVAVAQSMREVSGCVASVKWPNDILINGKKVCGILAEAKTRKGGQYPEYIVIGVGMNVNFAYDEFPPDIQAVATSLFLESGHLINRVERRICGWITSFLRRRKFLHYDFLFIASMVRRLSSKPTLGQRDINGGFDLWGISSAGRAPALHAGGRRFEPCILHQCRILSDICTLKTE